MALVKNTNNTMVIVLFLGFFLSLGVITKDVFCSNHGPFIVCDIFYIASVMALVKNTNNTMVIVLFLGFFLSSGVITKDVFCSNHGPFIVCVCGEVVPFSFFF